MSDKRFSTAELIAYVQRWKNCCASPYIDDESEADVQKCIDIEQALIARLRTADSLCERAERIAGTPITGIDKTEVDSFDISLLRKAIADYKEAT
jgi:hypothetical protein